MLLINKNVSFIEPFDESAFQVYNKTFYAVLLEILSRCQKCAPKSFAITTLLKVIIKDTVGQTLL